VLGSLVGDTHDSAEERIGGGLGDRVIGFDGHAMNDELEIGSG